jgi:putative aldouronate transport system substrate-binding protein
MTTAPNTTTDPAAPPAAAEPVKFRYYRDVYNGVAVQGWENMYWMQEWEKRMNVQIEFQGPASGDDFNTAVNIMLASGNYPEVVYNNWNNYSGGLAAAIEDGIVVNLSELYRDKLPNWFGLLEGNDNVRRAVTLDDGTSALLCHVEGNLKRAAYSGLGIRKDWCDKLGIPVPTTIDEVAAFCDLVLQTI